ncbi:MAG: LptF/LptG family permease, partial [Paracoccaceae bacterium]|nr:LptF/LptG family permease [Paracoccaceae bacterium]
GFSSFRLARPVLYFGLIVALMMMALVHVIVPKSRAILAERNAEISANVTARLLSDGKFMHPGDGITFYIRELAQSGELLDIFMSDDRTPAKRTTYTARRALLVRADTGPKLVMFDGMSQTLNPVTGRLAVTNFADFTYDLSGILEAGKREGRTVDELSTYDLLHPTEALLSETNGTIARFLSTGNGRFSEPLMAPAAALIGFGILLLGAFSRFGLWRQILGAILALILVQMLNNAGTSLSTRTAHLWPLVYVSPLAGLGFSALVLWYGQRPRRLRRSGSHRGGPQGGGPMPQVPA